MPLIQDIIVNEKQQERPKAAPVKNLITKLRRDLQVHKKQLAKRTDQRDAELQDIVSRLRTRR